jgi:hypothetical protein
MHYSLEDPLEHRKHGMRHDPFKALVAPRPIGWIGSVSKAGVLNLAPYSFFNAVSDSPPMVMFSSVGRKDSVNNIEETGEFTCSMATEALVDGMNLSSAPVAANVGKHLRAANLAAGFGLSNTETAHDVAPQAAPLDAHGSGVDMDASAACANAVSEALGDVGVHAAPIEAKEPAADVNRASVTLTSRYNDPIL